MATSPTSIDAEAKPEITITSDADLPLKPELSISCEAEYKQYPYDKAADIWTLVTLKAPCHEDENKRAPIDIVAVIDKSGSMSGAKLELVKKTLEFVIGQLKDDDRLSVVTYDTHVKVDFGLMNMDKTNKANGSSIVHEIRDGSSTNLSGGLLKGLCQIIDRGDVKNEVASVLLFTDGLANHGITSSNGIVAAMKDPKKFDGSMRSPSPQDHQQPRHKSWLQKITGRKTPTTKAGPIEHSEEASSKQPEKKAGLAASATVYCFGFGADHDPDMLKAISDAGNGMYYFIENEDQIAESFGHCLGGLLSTVGQGIQLELTTHEGVHINEVHVNRPYDTAADKKSLKVNMGDLQSEEERDVVIKMSLEALPNPRESPPQPLFDVVANYFNVISADLAEAKASLSVMRTKITENNPEESSVTVNKQRDRIETSETIRNATERADSDDLEGARHLLEEQIARNSSRAYSDDAYMQGLSSNLAQCSENLQSKSMWKKKGKKYNANMLQMHEQQRSSEPSVSRGDVYVTKSKGRMASKFKNLSKGQPEEEEEGAEEE